MRGLSLCLCIRDDVAIKLKHLMNYTSNVEFLWRISLGYLKIVRAVDIFECQGDTLDRQLVSSRLNMELGKTEIDKI